MKISVAKCLPVIAVILLAAPARAQESTSFTDDVLITSATCFAAPEGTTPAGTVTLCDNARTRLGNLMLAKAGATPGEVNVYRAMRATVLSILGSAQGQVDGFRSQRSCLTMEEAWLSAAYVDPSLTPEHAAEIAQVHDDVAKMVAVCRDSFAAPFAAPALP